VTEEAIAKCPICNSTNVRGVLAPANPTPGELLRATCADCGWHFTARVVVK
jgi:transposase-like protein